MTIVKRAFGYLAATLVVVGRFGRYGRWDRGSWCGCLAATPRTVVAGPWSIVPSPNPRPINDLAESRASRHRSALPLAMPPVEAP